LIARKDAHVAQSREGKIWVAMAFTVLFLLNLNGALAADGGGA
jgi:hypothetical protein